MPKLLPAAAEKIRNFVGIKFTSRDCAEAGSCLRLKRPNGKPFLFFFGSDEVILFLFWGKSINYKVWNANCTPYTTVGDSLGSAPTCRSFLTLYVFLC